MIGSRARRACRVLALAASAVLGTMASAAAQSGPTPLRPTAPVAMPERRAPSGFAVEPLKAPDVQGIGILDLKHDGFGLEMWDGTPRALVAKLLPALPARTPSPALRNLMRRLLLSAAAPPAGSGQGILLRRVERLWAMGEVEGMLKLLDAVPPAALDGALLRFRIDGLLLQGDTKAACAQLPAARRGADADGTVAQLSAFCDALAGRLAEASLTADWLNERNLGDPAFFAALEALTGTPGDIISLPQPRALHLAMMKAARLALPADAASGNEPAILRAVAADEGAAMEARLIAAEKAEFVGALDTEALRGLYSAVTFGHEAADRPLEDAASDAGWRSRALLFRIAQMQTAPAARAELIAKALQLAVKQGHFTASARLYAPLVEGLTPSPELAGFAPTAVRAMLAAGRRELAAAWVPLCAPNGPPVWPLLRLMEAHEDDPPAPGQLSAWLRQRTPLPPDLARRQATLLFGLLDALGERVRSEDWLELMDGPSLVTTTIPQPALWHGQRIAAEDLRLGETVLLALVSLGEGFPGDLDPTVVYRIVGALRLVGFDDEARAIALEAALAHGV